jgi:signal transduction histidine kinase
MPSQINQVFMNIIANATDAIADKGEITITTRLDNNGNVQVLIADTGQGMSDEVKKKLFDPFFTTKKIGQGTGLGLSVVYSIIEKHQARIDIDSEVGKGTTFIITLPKMTQTAENN